MGGVLTHSTRGFDAAGGRAATRSDLPELHHNRRSQAQQRRLLLLARTRRGLLLCYCLLVGAGTFAFQYWGCFCHDPTNGNPNAWNKTAQHDGVVLHECSGMLPVARLLGVDWCCVLGGGVAAQLYVTAPIIVWIARCYSKWLALLTLGQGAAVACGFTATIIQFLGGIDHPPGFGMGGVPLGAAYAAGLGVWLLFSLAAGRGYWINEVLGRTMRLSVAYLVGSAAVGIYVSFSTHAWLGPAVVVNLLVVAIWATQVRVTSGSLGYACLAYIMPLGIGSGLGFPLEVLASGMPPVAGVAVGSAAVFLTVLALSTVYERNGLRGAAFLAAFLFAQDAVVLTFFAAGYGLEYGTGALLAAGLESVVVGSILVSRREGNTFAVWGGALYAIVFGPFSLLLVNTCSQTWSLSLSTSAGVVFLLAWFVTVGLYRGSVAGMRCIFFALVCLLQASFLMVELFSAEMPPGLVAVFGGASTVLLLVSLMLGWKADDGAGALYGSGVEVLLYVCACQGVAFSWAFFSYIVLEASDGLSHMGAGIMGVIFLYSPSLTRWLAGPASAAVGQRNLRRGVVVALYLEALWGVEVVALRFGCDLDTDTSIMISSIYTLVFMLILCTAIWRFMLTLLLVYVGFLLTCCAMLYATYVLYAPIEPSITVCVLTIMGTVVPALAVYPLSQQRANHREDLMLEKHAQALQMHTVRLDAAKAARPHDPRKKHRHKTMILANERVRGTLPRLVDLTHNGVMERAGPAKWTVAASDGRPVLPMANQLVVCRGSFLYVFTTPGAGVLPRVGSLGRCKGRAPDDELLPTARAVEAIPLYSAQATGIPLCASSSVFTTSRLKHDAHRHGRYCDERMPEMHNLIAIELSLPWRGRSRIFLQFETAPLMQAWTEDLNERSAAGEPGSSASALRQSFYDTAALPDPSLAGGMLAARKAMARAVTDMERSTAAANVGRSEMHAREKRIANGYLGTHKAQSNIAATVALKNEARTDERSRLMAPMLNSIGGSVVMYTPRGQSGTALDENSCYPADDRPYPGLAASLRDAQQKNEVARCACTKQRVD